MTDLFIKILFLILSLYLGVLTWLGKTAWQWIKDNAAAIEKIKLNCAACKQDYHDQTTREIKELLEQIGDMMDEKLDAWWNKIENNLMNDGRLPPKRRQSKNQDQS